MFVHFKTLIFFVPENYDPDWIINYIIIYKYNIYIEKNNLFIYL